MIFMVLQKILIGLLGLGVIVFIHELGHFLVAKLCGIHVEVFSLGWGKRLVGFTRNGTDYRLSVFPIGGYCKMKGEEVLKKAMETNGSLSDNEPGSFFSASPLKRIAVSFAGPLFNLIFAVIVAASIWFIGFTYPSYGNKIVVISDYAGPDRSVQSAADKAGLKTGDRIIAINGEKITNYSDIQKWFATTPGEQLSLQVIREETNLTLSVTPELDKSNGVGRVGITAYSEPIVYSLETDSPAEKAGLRPGDIIVSVNGITVRKSSDFTFAPFPSDEPLSIRYSRNGIEYAAVLDPQSEKTNYNVRGIKFVFQEFHSEKMNILEATGKGIEETVGTLVLTVKGIGILFRGVDLRNAVTGVGRATYMIGDVAVESFTEGFGVGMKAVLNFLALIGIALAFMNLLPFPIFDGGMIVLFIIEMIRRKPVSVKTFNRYQMVGIAIILSLVAFAVFGDLSFFTDGRNF